MIRDKYDYIVVGAGSARSIIARRLVDNSDARVLLLEAGSHDHNWRIRMPGAVRSNYDKSSRFNWSRPPRNLIWTIGVSISPAANVWAARLQSTV